MSGAASPAREVLTREVVVTATRSLIDAEGLDAVSLRRVAASLGVTAPALYAYVDDKRDLLQGVAEGAFAELVERFEALPDADPIERIRSQSRVYVGFAEEQPEVFRTMFLFPPELAVSAPVGAELPAATRAFEVPRQAIEDAQAAGLLRSIDPTMAALAVWTSTHGLAEVLRMGFGFDQAGRDQLVDLAIDTVIAGLRS